MTQMQNQDGYCSHGQWSSAGWELRAVSSPRGTSCAVGPGLWLLSEEADMLVSYVSVSKRTMLSGKCCQTPRAAGLSYVFKTAQGLFTYIFKHPHTH